MSQRDVGYVIDRLLVDADLRLQFARDPVLTIAELYTLGYALTSDEIDAFVQSDLGCWGGERARVSGGPH